CYTVGTQTRWITPGPDGNIWFTDYNPGNGMSYLDAITTAGVTVQHYALPTTEDTNFTGLVTGPDGKLWIAEFDGHILRMNTSGGYVPFTMPGNPLLTFPKQIAAGPDGNLYFGSYASSLSTINPGGFISANIALLPGYDLLDP